MPLIEIVDIVQPRDGRHDALQGFYIDKPEASRVFDGDSVDTWGWVLGRTSAAVSVEFVHHGRLLRRVPVNVPRPDVAAVFPDSPAATRAGFRTEIPIAGRLAEFRIDICCTLANGERVPLGVVIARRRWRESYGRSEEPALVSIVIPCFNQAHYLSEAIESARAQTYPHIEIVIIDDGSPDNTAEVAKRFPGVRCVEQDNEGLSAARNTGIRRSNGMYLIFLDADDRLMPGAAESGLGALRAHPEAALTIGRCRWMTADGSPLPTPEHGCVPGDPFVNLLHGNCTGMPATVMYRRGVFEAVLGFDTTGAYLGGCEDYELALRIARQFPVCCHAGTVAEYRVRGRSMSRNTAQMLDTSLRAVRAQRKYARDSAELRAAYAAGIRFWKEYYGQSLVQEIEGHAQRRQWSKALQKAWVLARRYPLVLAR